MLQLNVVAQLLLTAPGCVSVQLASRQLQKIQLGTRTRLRFQISSSSVGFYFHCHHIPQQRHIMTKNCENSSNTANTRVLCCQSANLRVGVKLESQAYRYVLTYM